MGIIDKDYNKIKEPSTNSELDAYTMLDRMAFKIRKALMRSPDRTARRLLTFAAAIALLREQKDFDSMDDDEFDVLIDMYSQDENVINEAKTLESGQIPFRYFMLDEEIANAAGPMGGGAIAGIGTGPQGEPAILHSCLFKDVKRRRGRQMSTDTRIAVLENEMEKMDGFFSS